MNKMPLNKTMLMKSKHKEKERNNECKQILWKREDQYLSPFSPIETKFTYKNKIRNKDMIPSTITSYNSLAENAMDIGKTSLKCTRLNVENIGFSTRYNILVTPHKLLYLHKVT
jgi:poly-D-alanine transfer protein DltD